MRISGVRRKATDDHDAVLGEHMSISDHVNLDVINFSVFKRNTAKGTYLDFVENPVNGILKIGKLYRLLYTYCIETGNLTKGCGG